VTYLFDTNVCIKLINGSSAKVAKRLRVTAPDEIRLSSIARAELLFGAYRSAHVAENVRLVERFCRPYVSLSFDDACAQHYGVLRADLARRGMPIGPNDLFIASTALAHELTLVTHNVAEFSRVVGLKLEDWERS
jgi:tRNA(fMet)-specific endonuclease VapC